MDERNRKLHYGDGRRGHQIYESSISMRAPLSSPHLELRAPQQIDVETDLAALYVRDAWLARCLLCRALYSFLGIS
jgi:hypothetical protein